MLISPVCAPKSKNGKCPSTDHPDDYKGVPAPVDQHCQLPCSTDADCGAGGRKCLPTNGTKICLWPSIYNYGNPWFKEGNKQAVCDGDQ